MKNHMIYIIPNRFIIMPQEMFLNLQHPLLHLHVSSHRNRYQNLPQIRNLLLRHKHSERFPIQYLKKRWHKVVRYNHRNATIQNRLHHSRAIHLVSFSANAESAAFHVPDVRFVIDPVKDLHIWFGSRRPLVKQDGSNVTM